MNGDPALYRLLEKLKIPYDYYEHPPVATITEARKYWKDINAAHCKNLFFRNHKGNRHYLVIIEHSKDLHVSDLEKRIGEGKLSFASPERIMKYLGLRPGSVSPFGLIHDKERHVHLFIDETLREAEKVSFHPCINTASIVVPFTGLIRFLDHIGNTYEFRRLYE